MDYQARASVFEPGDRVYPVLGGNPAAGGMVIAVWPAIGMVDVQFPHGSSRYPVEDLAIDTSGNFEGLADFQADSIPGGTPTVSVPGGPARLQKDVREERVEEAFRNAAEVRVSVDRVAEAYVKKALYWNAPDRKYRMTKAEIESGCPSCPKCSGVELRKVIYKREDGKNERLYACGDCLFMIRRADIIGFED